MSLVNRINANEFTNQVENGEGFALVDFYADWCGPCQMVAPVLAQVAEDYEAKLNVVKVDADAHPEILAKYGVRGIPTLILFKDGQPVDVTVGAQPYQILKAKVEQHIQA